MYTTPHFRDRYDAGRRLGAALLVHQKERPLTVLGLARGGVPVAALVAETLHAPLDVFVVRKLGLPGHEELAMGAIASGGVTLFNSEVIEPLGVSRIAIERVVAAERQELERREVAYRGTRHQPSFAGEVVIVVDDGAATGASMRVAIQALRKLGPRRIIAAVPVASREAAALLAAEADECVSIIVPEPFIGVGMWYGDFSQTTDGEVRVLLSDARRRWEAEAPVARRVTT